MDWERKELVMNDALAKIRKPCIFILLLILNFRFLFTVVLDDRQEILSALTIVFFLLSFDYTAMRREYLYWLGLFVIIALAEFTPYKLNVLTPIILMQCVSTLNFKTYLRYNILILGATVTIMFIVVGTGKMIQSDTLSFIRVRYDFGFGHPNIAAIYYWGLFASILLYCYLSRYRNFVWILLGGLLLFSIFLYTETVSRSFILTIFSFIVVVTYYSLRSRFQPNYRIGYSRYILYILPLLFTALSIYLAINVEKYSALNMLVSTRLTLYKELIDSLSPLQFLLGTTAFDRIIVDSSYMHLLFEAGILLFIYFIYLYIFAIRNIVKQQNIFVIAVFTGFLVYGIMESLLLFSVIIGNNLFWVLLYKYRYAEGKLFDTESKQVN